MTKGGFRNCGVIFSPAKSMEGTTTGVDIFLRFGPRFQATPLSLSLRRHSAPTFFMETLGGQVQLRGILARFFGRFLRIVRFFEPAETEAGAVAMKRAAKKSTTMHRSTLGE